jgi:hypothetical protein
MRFMSKYDNAVYIIDGKSKDTVFMPGGRVQRIPGVRATFGGRSHIFDSQTAQQKYRWSDEQREQVEEYLLNHQDFGRDFYLAPDEPMTDRVKELLSKVQPSSDTPFFKCSKIIPKDDGFDQCPNNAVLGKDFCEIHLPSGIVQGMLTSAS